MPAPLIYGAYGYTGELVARKASRAGFDPLLAGRRQAPLRELAADLGMDFRVATLDELSIVLADDDIEVCLHCAGPFVNTYEPAVDACLATGTHYLDVTGEVSVFEAIRRFDDRARDAGVMLLPGVGFDVVPPNCLAARLHDQLPEATRLTLAYIAPGQLSPGTARSAMHYLGRGVPVREDGDLRYIPIGSRTRDIDTGTGYGPQRMSIIPRGSVATAYHTTGIPNIEVYIPSAMGLSPTGQRVLGWLQPLFGVGPVKRVLASLADHFAEEPDADVRAEGSAFYWGEVDDGDRTVCKRVHTPHPYEFTAASMVETTQRVLKGAAPPGYQTPASAYGSELVVSIDGVRFEDVEPGSED